MRRALLASALAFAAAVPANTVLAGERSELELKPIALITSHLYEGTLRDPRGVFYDAKNDEVWVADTANDLLGVFTPDAMELFACGRNRMVNQPIRVAVDANGRVLVLGADRSKIRVLNSRGEYLNDLKLPNFPEKAVVGTITVDRDGNLYVGENESGQVLVYSKDLKLKLRFGRNGDGEGEFQSIAGIASDKSFIYVVDSQVMAVQIFDKRGDFVKGWGRHDMGVQNFSLPSGVAVDSKGRIFVVDALRHEIKLFDKEGNFIDRFGGLGAQLGQVSYPSDIAIDPSDHVYVVDKGNSRVQVFETIVNPLQVPERSSRKETGDRKALGNNSTTGETSTNTNTDSMGEGKQ